MQLLYILSKYEPCMQLLLLKNILKIYVTMEF